MQSTVTGKCGACRHHGGHTSAVTLASCRHPSMPPVGRRHKSLAPKGRSNETQANDRVSFCHALTHAPETTPGANAPPLLIQEGSIYGSPPQMRRGGAPGDGVVLSRASFFRPFGAKSTALWGLKIYPTATSFDLKIADEMAG